MDFLHTRIKIVSRNKGKSAVSAAAYRSGTKIENLWDGVTHDYTHKQHIMLMAKGSTEVDPSEKQRTGL